jgi:hypothetical protein
MSGIPAEPWIGLRVSYEDDAHPKRIATVTAINASWRGVDYTLEWDEPLVLEPDDPYPGAIVSETRSDLRGPGWQVAS